MSATEGWSDADEDDTLRYQFAYKMDTQSGQKKAKYFKFAPQAESSLTTQLPTGIVDQNFIEKCFWF